MIETPTQRATPNFSNRQFAWNARTYPHLAAALCAALALTAAGCSVQTEKGANGEDKTVKVETPFGSVHTEKGANGEDKNVRIDTPIGDLHVNTDQTTASDLGLPVYPGAQPARDKENDKSADLHMGFGKWQLSVKAVNYTTADSQDKVAAFYRKAFGRYGDVITCRNHKPVGTPTTTGEGLTCTEDNGRGNINGTHIGSESDGIELKAGSKHHQHILGFDDSSDGNTHFSLAEVEIPTEGEVSGKSD